MIGKQQPITGTYSDCKQITRQWQDV